MAMGNQKVPQTLISIAALFLMVANMALSQTTSFKIQKFLNPPGNDLSYQGDAFVPSGTSYLRLTKADTYSVGRLMYTKSIQFSDKGKQVKFETTIKFKITPTNDSPGEGIAFFISPVGSTIPDGSQGGNFGIFSSTGTGNSIFAVEIDTFPNSWDPPYRHIGIDINSRISSSLEYLDDSVIGKVVTLHIVYSENSITATTKVGSQEYNEVSYDIDLSTILNKEVQVGISASTGGSVSFQDIYSWQFTSTMINDEGTVDGAGIRKVVST